MKKLILTIAAIASVVGATDAFAGGRHQWRHGSGAYYEAVTGLNASSSWDAIYRRGLRPAWPQVPFVGTGDYVPVANLCVDGDNLRGGRSSRCLEYTTNGENTECTRTVSYDLVTPRRYLAEIVELRPSGDSYDRVVVGYNPQEHALAYDIPVMIDVPTSGDNNGGRESQLAFTKPFVIPACAGTTVTPPPVNPPGRGH